MLSLSPIISAILPQSSPQPAPTDLDTDQTQSTAPASSTPSAPASASSSYLAPEPASSQSSSSSPASSSPASSSAAQVAPISTRQTAEIVEAVTRQPERPTDPDFELEQARAAAIAAQARWRDEALIAAISPEANRADGVAAAQEATAQPPANGPEALLPSPPRLMMTA